MVLEFLTDLFDRGFSHSALNTARSSLSSYMTLKGNCQVGDHPSICRFMKGVYQLRTPLPKYQSTWDVNLLLEFFKGQNDSQFLSLKELTQKLCALLLISSAQRVQTIHVIKLNGIMFHDRGCTIMIKDKLKSTRPAFHQKALQLERYQDKKVCVVDCLREYLTRTKDLRGKVDSLFVCYSKPHGAASKDSIARWLKELLIKAGITGFDAHSFRSAASSELFRKGVPIDTILEKAGWSNAKTFHTFYNRGLLSDENPTEKRVEQASILNYLK